jgi:SWI/SNF-related matrix-associated actin-dependent regulator 1 of chromatin subfamily A
VIINYDIVHRVPGLRDTPWDLLIADEAIALKSHNALRTAAVFGGTHKGKRCKPIPAKTYLLLSGTPMPNRIEEIATLVEALDPKSWSFKQLIREYYQGDVQVDDKRRVNGTPRNLRQLQSRLRHTVMVRILKDDVLELPPKTHQDIRVSLPSPIMMDRFATLHHRRIILLSKLRKAWSQELADQLNGLQEHMQHMSGACSFKIDAVIEYLLQQREKVVVFAYHQGVIHEYAERLRKAGRKVVVLTGDNTKKTQQVVDRFRDDPEIQFFIGNMKVAGQGLTLTAASLAVFAELDWSPGVMEQCEDRLHRIGQERPVRIVRFLLEDSLDMNVVDAISRKLGHSRIALNPNSPRLVKTKDHGLMPAGGGGPEVELDCAMVIARKPTEE